MTAVAEDLDLSWVVFTEESDSLGCEWDDRKKGPCPQEAVAIAVLDVTCTHLPGQQRLCVSHRDQLLQIASNAELLCVVCDAPVALLRMEPIR